MEVDKKYFFIYPKDKNGKRTGHTLCILMGVDKNNIPRAYYGIALCSEKDQFSYVEGRSRALARAEEAYSKKAS